MIDKQIIEKLYEKSGEEFIREAYRKVLLRDVDDSDLKFYKQAIESGLSKSKILYELIVSEEGQNKNVVVNGLLSQDVSAAELLDEKNDELFIKKAYVAALGRSADGCGMDTYIDALRNGSMDRIDVLIALINSEEGKNSKNIICGFNGRKRKRKIRNTLFRIPILGGYIRYRYSLVRISRMNMQEVGQCPGSVEQRLGSVEQRLGSVEQRLRNAEQINDSVRYKLNDFVNKDIKKQIHQNRNSRLTTGIAYKEYEDAMRGSRQEIIERLKIYDVVFQRVKANNGKKINALDLGCGRGEWLELAQNTYNVYALGVDSDESMLTDCTSHNLNAVRADLIDYIKSAESNSVDIITMFQVAEHLPIAVLNDVLNECYRVMKKGGALIVETPNPENLIIGACNFYFDPTHITKIPPTLLEILVKGVGLRNTEIVRMHEYKAIDINESEDIQTPVKQLAGFFNNYADYAVIAYKEV